jgi:hypothetical protein
MPSKFLTGTLLILIFQFLGCRISESKVTSGESVNEFSEDEEDANIAGMQLTDPGSFRPGRYMGYFKLPERNLSFPMIIDLVAYREIKGIRKLRSVVRILHQSFISHEYSSQYFPFVDYLSKKGELNFKSQKGPFVLSGLRVHDQIIQGSLKVKDPSVSGIFSVAWQPEGTSLTNYQDMLNEFPTMQNLTGSYRGVCGGVKTTMQLEVHKKSKDLVSTTAFDWNIVGRIGEQNSKSCGASAADCLKTNYETGTYNFALGTIDLGSGADKMLCKLGESGLNCGDCNFKEIKTPQESLHLESQYKVLPRQHHITAEGQDAVPVGVSSSPTDVAGLYFGYLHHEALGSYQLVRLNIQASSKEVKGGEKWDYLHGSATLFFGNSTQREFIAYQFLPRRYLKTRRVFMFDGNGESFLSITRWTKNGAEGVWFSKNFGRVGTIELVRGGVPKISSKVPILASVAGNYSGKFGRIQLTTKSSLSTNDSAYYPIKIFGSVVDYREKDRRTIVVGGDYDFYGGTLSLELDDQRKALGHFSAGSAEIFWPATVRQGSPLGPQQPQSFAVEPEPIQKQSPSNSGGGHPRIGRAGLNDR